MLVCRDFNSLVFLNCNIPPILYSPHEKSTKIYTSHAPGFDTVICSKNINFVGTIFPLNHDLFYK